MKILTTGARVETDVLKFFGYEPMEPEELPFVTPEEDDAPSTPRGDLETVAKMYGVSPEALEQRGLRAEYPNN